MLTQTSQLESKNFADLMLWDLLTALSTTSKQGWYETGLSCKGDRTTLPNNESGSLQRLRTPISKLQRAEQQKNT